MTGDEKPMFASAQDSEVLEILNSEPLAVRPLKSRKEPVRVTGSRTYNLE